MKCKLCEVEIEPYQPGTVLVEADEASTGVWHEACYKQYREDYVTADEVIAEEGILI